MNLRSRENDFMVAGGQVRGHKWSNLGCQYSNVGCIIKFTDRLLTVILGLVRLQTEKMIFNLSEIKSVSGA